MVVRTYRLKREWAQEWASEGFQARSLPFLRSIFAEATQENQRIGSMRPSNRPHAEGCAKLKSKNPTAQVNELLAKTIDYLSYIFLRCPAAKKIIVLSGFSPQFAHEFNWQ